MRPPAPVLFSTMNTPPEPAPILCATTRVTMSVTPPAAKGTRILTGLAGYCAAAAVASTAQSKSAATRGLSIPEYRRSPTEHLAHHDGHALGARARREESDVLTVAIEEERQRGVIDEIGVGIWAICVPRSAWSVLEPRSAIDYSCVPILRLPSKIGVRPPKLNQEESGSDPNLAQRHCERTRSCASRDFSQRSSPTLKTCGTMKSFGSTSRRNSGQSLCGKPMAYAVSRQLIL